MIVKGNLISIVRREKGIYCALLKDIFLPLKKSLIRSFISNVAAFYLHFPKIRKRTNKVKEEKLLNIILKAEISKV